MREVDLQSEIVRAVNAHGGFAFKLSNRFLVGVADLFIKLPAFNAAFIEVKYDEAPKQKNRVTIAPTPLQTHFLEGVRKAGCHAGIASFLKRGTEIGLLVSPAIGSFAVWIDVYDWAKPRDRAKMIWQAVERFVQKAEYGDD